MTATGSLNRSKWGPEEWIRQALIHQMIHELGYPKGRLVIEKELRHFVSTPDVPRRRIDLLVYGAGFQPLLLVECKAVPLTRAAMDQVLGYNYYVRAPVVALVNRDEVKTGWWTGSGYQQVPGLPAYSDLDPYA